MDATSTELTLTMPESKTERIQVRFTPSQRERLEELADAERRPVASLVRSRVLDAIEPSDGRADRPADERRGEK